MPGHWSLAFGFRQRLSVEKDKSGKPEVRLDSKLLGMIGITDQEEVQFVISESGEIVIRKL